MIFMEIHPFIQKWMSHCMIEYRDVKYMTLRNRLLFEMKSPYKGYEEIWRRSSIKGKRQINKAKRRGYRRKRAATPLKVSRKKFRAFYFSSQEYLTTSPHPSIWSFSSKTVKPSSSLYLFLSRKILHSDFLAIFSSSKILFYFPTDFSVF